MMYMNRIWCISRVATAVELAEKLTQRTWCCCTGFELDGYLWLNDSTGENGAQEYAVVRKPTDDDPHFWQVESITASWCSESELLRCIHDVQGGIAATEIASGPVVVAKSLADLSAALGVNDRPQSFIVHPRVETPEQHGRCHHCA
jgi:hypothetical protein